MPPEPKPGRNHAASHELNGSVLHRGLDRWGHRAEGGFWEACEHLKQRYRRPRPSARSVAPVMSVNACCRLSHRFRLRHLSVSKLRSGVRIRIR